MKDLMQLVHSVEKRIDSEHLENVLGLQAMLKQYEGEDWRDYFTSGSKPPKNHVLLQNEQVKIVLIHWYAFQKSKKHGHPSGGGLFKVLTGTLKETRFDPLDTDKVIGSYDYFKGNLAYIHDAEAYHIVENPIPYPAVSLHVYMPGISVPNIVQLKQTTPQTAMLKSA